MAIDIFEGKTNGFATGLFLFDNTPSHQKCAPDALSAQKMPKNPHPTWTHYKEGPKMHTTQFGEDQRIQDLYFNHDHPRMLEWFKGMEIITWECGLWLEKGMNAQCDGFKCVAGKTNCCSRRLLFTQPDFMAQKSHLEELITSHSHICDFYPKYHCELNFIEQYWAAKLCYWNSPKTTDINKMEANMKASLDSVPLVQAQTTTHMLFRPIFVTATLPVVYIDVCDVNLPPINANLQHPSVMISMSTGDLVPSKAPCPCNLKTNKSKYWQSLCDTCDISYTCTTQHVTLRHA